MNRQGVDRWRPSQIDRGPEGQGEPGRRPVEPVHPAQQRDDDDEYRGAGLTNLEYALCAEMMGRVVWAPEVFNCSAPDTGNMEVLERYGTAEQKERWLEPLLAGEIRSAFAMTEPEVASSDATNIQTRIAPRRRRLRHQRPQVVDLGRRRPALQDLSSSWARPSPTRRRHRQQSMILVPRDTPGVKVERLLPVFGYDDAPHGHARGDAGERAGAGGNILLGEGRGFEIAQGRLGPGPHPPLHAHHRRWPSARSRRCAAGSPTRVAFGKPLAEQSVWQRAHRRGAHPTSSMTRLLCLKAAAHDGHRSATRRRAAEIAMIKVAAPSMALRGHRRPSRRTAAAASCRGLRARRRLRAAAHAAHRRRARRGAQPRHRPAGIRPSQQCGGARA